MILFAFILPFFSSLTFFTRKGIDFKLWCIGVLAHRLGYFYLPIGRILLIEDQEVYK